MCLLYITMRSNFHKTRNWSANKNSPGICKDDTDLIRPGRITMKPTLEQNALVKACHVVARCGKLRMTQMCWCKRVPNRQEKPPKQWPEARMLMWNHVKSWTNWTISRSLKQTCVCIHLLHIIPHPIIDFVNCPQGHQISISIFPYGLSLILIPRQAWYTFAVRRWHYGGAWVGHFPSQPFKC